MMPNARLVVGEVLDGAARVCIAIGGGAGQTSAGTFFRTQTRLCRLDHAAGLSGALPMSLGTDRKPCAGARDALRQSAEISRQFCYRTPPTGHSSFQRRDRELPRSKRSDGAPPNLPQARGAELLRSGSMKSHDDVRSPNLQEQKRRKNFRLVPLHAGE
jgi:hypothetical protein